MAFARFAVYAVAVLTAAAQAQPAPITAVTVYPGAATVVRTARVEAGSTRLVIPDLPTRFSSETLRIESDSGIRIGTTTVQDSARTESANAAEAAIEAKIQQLQDQAAALDVQAGAADIVKGFLERTGGGQPNDRPVVAPDAKAFTAMVGAMNQAATDALAKKQQVALQKRDIEKKIAALQRDLQRARSESRDSRTLTIQLAAERTGNVRVSYQLNSAGWKPAYRAELDSSNSRLTLERLAQVSQKSGEEWKAVKLTLSTAQPRQAAAIPVPSPWLLSYVAPAPRDGLAKGVASPMFAPAPAPSGVARQEPAGEDYHAPTFQTDSTFATEFTLPQPVTLPSDGREIALPLVRIQLPADQLTQVAPRLSTTAMATAEVARPDGVWPAGALQLYRDGNYVGALAWAPTGKDRWTFSFGRDDLVQVQVVPFKGDSASTGLIEKRNVRQIDERFTVRSNHRAPIELLVVEAAPVSTSEEVKVTTAFIPKPSAEPWDDRRGVVAWKRSIAPQETASFEVKYTIEYPKEGRVNGLR